MDRITTTCYPACMTSLHGSECSSNAIDPQRLFLDARVELLRYARTIVSEIDEADDVVQEAWLRFSAATRRPDRLLSRGFIFRMLRNLATDRYRRRQIERRLFDHAGEDALNVPSDEPSAQIRAEAAAELALIQAAIDRLPERTRRALLLNRVHGHTLVEVAGKLGISKSLAQQLVVDGLDACRQAQRRGR
jgi:RNA polymerase sigma-70 factor (ECF subfamily)